MVVYKYFSDTWIYTKHDEFLFSVDYDVHIMLIIPACIRMSPILSASCITYHLPCLTLELPESSITCISCHLHQLCQLSLVSLVSAVTCVNCVSCHLCQLCQLSLLIYITCIACHQYHNFKHNVHNSG